MHLAGCGEAKMFCNLVRRRLNAYLAGNRQQFAKPSKDSFRDLFLNVCQERFYDNGSKGFRDVVVSFCATFVAVVVTWGLCHGARPAASRRAAVESVSGRDHSRPGLGCVPLQARYRARSTLRVHRDAPPPPRP